MDGVTPRKSTATVAASWPPGDTRRYPPPPSPEAKGSATPIASETATAASTALPPSARTSRPASAARGCAATTIPDFDRATLVMGRDSIASDRLLTMSAGNPGWKSRPARYARAALIGLGIPFLLLAVATMAFGDRFIFFPTRYPEGDWAARERARIPVDEVEFTISDGTRLVAWHARAPGERCTFLYFHGN